ncbi:MAG: hypothetical protein ABL959_13230 [Pyrinomonadaceae bacterium]
MIKIIAVVLLALLATPAVGAQKSNLPIASSKVIGKCTSRQKLIDQQRSLTYLTFLRREVIKTGDKSADGDYLFFTFTNNSCWPVWLDMSGVATKLHGDASLYYAIESKNSGAWISGRLYCHVCSTNLIGPGGKVTFSIPFEEASRDARMRIVYEFDWEREVHSDNNEHTVSYYFSNLPETVLSKLSDTP